MEVIADADVAWCSLLLCVCEMRILSASFIFDVRYFNSLTPYLCVIMWKSLYKKFQPWGHFSVINDAPRKKMPRPSICVIISWRVYIIHYSFDYKYFPAIHLNKSIEIWIFLLIFLPIICVEICRSPACAIISTRNCCDCRKFGDDPAQYIYNQRIHQWWCVYCSICKCIIFWCASYNTFCDVYTIFYINRHPTSRGHFLKSLTMSAVIAIIRIKWEKLWTSRITVPHNAKNTDESQILLLILWSSPAVLLYSTAVVDDGEPFGCFIQRTDWPKLYDGSSHSQSISEELDAKISSNVNNRVTPFNAFLSFISRTFPYYII